MRKYFSVPAKLNFKEHLGTVEQLLNEFIKDELLPISDDKLEITPQGTETWRCALTSAWTKSKKRPDIRNFQGLCDMKKLLGLIFIILGVGLAIFVKTTAYYPPKIKEIPVQYSNTPAIPLKTQQPIKVLSWNIQFAAGNKDNYFFFSGGTNRWPSKEKTLQVIDEIAKAISKHDPDIILLQEADTGAKRTHYLDQVSEIQKRLKSKYHSRSQAFYWKSPFVPHPQMMGPVGMVLATLSKYKIQTAKRHSLPYSFPRDFLTIAYIFKRAAFQTSLTVEGRKEPLVINNTHLSSFKNPYHIETMKNQVSFVKNLMLESQNSNGWGLLAGDFNLPASSKNYARLNDQEKNYYHPNQWDIKPLYDEFQGVPSSENVDGPNYADWYTHSSVRSGDKSLNKTIDYIFLTNKIQVLSSQVLQEYSHLSDHAPVLATVELNP